jgi:hypothetical protein
MRRLPPRTSGDSETPAAVVPNTADAFGYEDVVTQRERDFIVYRTGSLGARLGYSSPDRRPRRLRMLRSWLLPDRWELMNVQPRRAFLPALLSRRAYVLRKLVRGT